MSFSFDPVSFKLGARSRERLVQAVAQLLCEGEERCPLAEIVPYVLGIDPEEAEEMLSEYFAWMTLKWVYNPRGLPPEVKQRILSKLLARGKLLLDEKYLVGEVAGGGLGALEEELGEEVVE